VTGVEPQAMIGLENNKKKDGHYLYPTYKFSWTNFTVFSKQTKGGEGAINFPSLFLQHEHPFVFIFLHSESYWEE
jgi:hypothetical protein